jgi:hypothetical protein
LPSPNINLVYYCFIYTSISRCVVSEKEQGQKDGLYVILCKSAVPYLLHHSESELEHEDKVDLMLLDVAAEDPTREIMPLLQPPPPTAACQVMMEYPVFAVKRNKHLGLDLTDTMVKRVYKRERVSSLHLSEESSNCR